MGLNAGTAGVAVVTDAGSLWTNSSFYMGTNGNAVGELTIQNGGRVTATANSFLGNSATSRGEATVTGAGSLWISGTSLFAGYSGTGILSIEDGGEARSTSHAYIGWGAGSSGDVTVTGAGSLLTGGATLYVGNSGTGILTVEDGGAVSAASILNVGTGNGSDGTLQIESGGTVTSASSAILGNAAGSTGEATVTGAGSLLSGTAIYVASSGTGTLTIEDGGEARSTTSHTYVGSAAGSTGHATVRGADSLLSSGGQFYVGSSGTGTLIVEDGGTVSAASIFNVGTNNGSNGTLQIESGGTVTSTSSAILGSAAGSTGEATVTGAGSLLSGIAIYVASSGTGTLTIEDSGEVRSTTSHTYIGHAAGSTGDATITGAGSLLSSGGLFYVGNSGNGTLTIDGGGEVATVSHTYIGTAASSTGEATVTGAGSLLDVGNQFVVGSSGTGRLTIEDGGEATSTGTTYIGNSAGSTGEATVTGTGSLLKSSVLFYVGISGTGTLTVDNGGEARSTNNFILGQNATGIGTATVRGSGSLLNSSAILYVGNNTGSSGTLVVEDGGEARSTGNLSLAQGIGSTGDATITGAGSTMDAGNQLIVGVSGTGTLTVEDGGEVTSTSYTYIGSAAGSTGEATITGTGSLLDSGGELRVGSSGNGTLTIEDGGQAISAGIMTLGAAASGIGTVTVSGAGSRMESESTLVVGGSGTGTLTVEDGGSAISTSHTYIGNSAGSTGDATITGAGSRLESGGQLRLGNSGTGTLTISDGGTVDVAGTFTIANAVGSVGTLNIGAAEGDAAAAAGIIDAATVTFGSGTGEIVFNHTETDYDFSSAITGSGALTFLSGTTILSGDSSGFTGTLSVTDALLKVSGQLAGTTTIGSGGRFAGTGSLGDVIFENGAVVAPGNSIGTTPVVNATFNPGSTYEVEINAAGQSDLLDASGTVTINGGTVEVIPFPDYALGTPYTIITAAGGLAGGPFDTLTLPAGLITGSLTYGANDVILTLSGNAAGMGARAQTANQRAVAAASGNAGNAAMTALYATSDAASSRRALDALSGEVHAGMSAVQIREQQQLRDMATRRRPDIGRTLGDETLWASGFGTVSRTDGDGNAASSRHRAGGVMVGGEKQFEEGHAGVAAGHSLTRLDVDGRASEARSKNYHLIGYGGHGLNERGLSLDGGASYTLHAIETDRVIAFEGFSGESDADYHAHTTQLFARVTQALAHGATTLKPYAEAALIHHRAGGFHESGEAGLEAGHDRDTLAMTTLGIEAEHRFDAGNRAILIEGGIGWRHTIGDDAMARTLAFRDETHTGFTVHAAPIERDALLLNAGLGTEIAPGIGAFIGYAGSLATGTRSHAISARIGIEF